MVAVMLPKGKNVKLSVICICTIFIMIIIIPKTFRRTNIQDTKQNLQITTVRSDCKVSKTSAPFIWDELKNENWYVIHESRDNIKADDFQRANFTIHPVVIKAMSVHPLPSYNKLAESLDEPDKVNKILDHSNHFGKATFDNVWVNDQGWIVNMYTCKARRNGGCLSPSSYWDVPNTYIHHYENVISIAARWTHGIWHYPMEALVALAHVPKEQIQQVRIHIESKSSYTKQWTELIGIDWERIITGTTSVTHLTVPKMGGCGAPTRLQLDWLEGKLPIRKNMTRDKVVLIKRTKTRIVKNFDEIEYKLRSFCQQTGTVLVIHDDRKLPVLKQQLELFRSALIVIGPHGAGEVNLIASLPYTCVVEFMDPLNVNICYSRVAYLRRLHYNAIPIVSGSVRWTDIFNSVQKCKRLN